MIDNVVGGVSQQGLATELIGSHITRKDLYKSLWILIVRRQAICQSSPEEMLIA
jgi:hypothetical protein